MLKNVIITSIIVALCGPLTSLVASVWQVDTNASSINFVSVKKENIVEAHIFKEFSGTVNEQGVAEIVISTNSVESSVEIRNNRMREFLFETANFPEIKITADVSKLTMEKNMIQTLPAMLSLHGVQKEVELNVLVTKASDNSMVVATAKPVIIKAADYNLDGGVAKLSELMGGISIGKTVPVSFALTFAK